MKDKKRKVLIFDLDDTLFDSTNQPEDMGKEWTLRFFAEFQEILESKDYLHILVTRGIKNKQNRKIDVLGIRKYFADIHIVDSDERKHERFAGIKDAFSDAEIIVIGNRIDCEIRYGNLLGMKTIHIRHGKYENLVPKDRHEVPSKAFYLHEVIDLKDFI